MDQQANHPYHPQYPIALHNGGPIPDWMNFFWKPSDKIGPVRCAFSTFDRRRPDYWFMRPKWRGTVICALTAFFAIPAVILLVLYLEGKGKPPFWDWPSATLGCFMIGALGTIGVVASKAFRIPSGDTCTYVGEAGLARARLGEFTGKLNSVWVFEYADNVSLSTLEREVHSKRQGSNVLDLLAGTYAYTQLCYQWNDISGRCVFEIKGTYDKNNPTPQDPAVRDFAYAAENVWFEYRTQCVRQQIKNNGAAVFHVDNGRQLEIAERAVKMVGKKGEQRLVPVAEMESLLVDEISIKFNFREESFYFRFAGVGDHRLCKATLEQLCKVDFGDREGLVQVWGA